ncbi:hypothetical protein [Amnibacterium endophyticum]|uniref:MFS transporter n=1 Tax=Amnibacterium endophyticum TaxID=2109337 RepID=A0ABW4LAQ3_9MICO
MRGVALRTAVAVPFAAAFGWQVFGAISNLLVWTRFAASVQQQLSVFAWLVLLVGLAIPVVAFAAAVVAGRRRGLAPWAVILLVALCASQALGMSQLAFFQAGTGSL